MLGQSLLGLSLPKPLLLLGLLALGLVFASCSFAQGGNAMVAQPQTQVEIPPLDRAAPAEVRTATFAMG